MYPETLNLEVTQEHIDKGKAESMKACPIALAAREHISKTPAVGHTWIWYPRSRMPVDVRYYPVGTHREEMEAWTRAFDEGEGVEPITLVFRKS